MTVRQDLERALWHLRTAQRLLRSVYALQALVSLNRAIRLVERLTAADRPAQPSLALEVEPPDAASV